MKNQLQVVSKDSTIFKTMEKHQHDKTKHFFRGSLLVKWNFLRLEKIVCGRIAMY